MHKRKDSRVLRPKEAPAEGTTPIDLNDCYTVKQVCEMFGVHERTVRYWRQKKKLVSITFERRVLFPKGPTDIALERYKRLGFL